MLSKPPDRREAWLIWRLGEADGPAYDELVGELAQEFPHDNRHISGIRAVRTVRWTLWSKLATTEPDESVWLTPAGWAALAELQQMVGAR